MTSRVAFTQANVRKLPARPGKPQTWIHDSNQRGLVLLITAAGARAFYFYRKLHNGRVARIRLGDVETMSVDQARKLTVEYHRKVNNGEDIIDTRQKKRQKDKQAVTLGELWEAYRDDHLKVKATAKTLITDESRFNTCLADWKGRRIELITAEECGDKHKLLSKQRGAPTADKALKLLRRMFNWQKINPNPAGGKAIAWNVGKNDDERRRYLDGEELPRFLAAVEHESNPTLRDFLKLCLFVGQRRSNMASMRWDELDLVTGVWNIPGSKAKSGKDTPIPLSAEAVAILRKRRDLQAEAPSEWVFPSHRRNPTVPHLTEPRFALARACKRAGIKNLWLHDLRRTMGVWQAMSGASELVIGESLGHTDRESTRRYSRMANLAIVRASMQKAVEAMNAKPAKQPAKKQNKRR